MRKQQKRTTEVKCSAKCHLPDFEEIRALLKTSNIRLRNIYTILAEACRYERINRLERKTSPQKRYRFSITVKKQRFSLNYVRFFYGAFVIKQNEALTWEAFIKKYWVDVRDVAEVQASFEDKFNYLCSLNLHEIFSPLVAVQQVHQVSSINEGELGMNSNENVDPNEQYINAFESVGEVNFSEIGSANSVYGPPSQNNGSMQANNDF